MNNQPQPNPGAPSSVEDEWPKCGGCGDRTDPAKLVKCCKCLKKFCAGCTATKAEEHGDEFTASGNVCNDDFDDMIED